MCGLTPSGRGQPSRRRRRAPAQRGQALLETALVLPVLLLLALGVVGVGRVLQAQMAVSAVAREAARVAALAGTPSEASSRGAAHAQAVARGYGLTLSSLEVTVEPGDLTRGGRVRSAARYDVTLDDLPLLGWARVTVRSEHVERVDLYRSRWSGGER